MYSPSDIPHPAKSKENSVMLFGNNAERQPTLN